MRKLLSLYFCIIFFSGFSQKKDINYQLELSTGISTEDNLPFWMIANQFGAVPNHQYYGVMRAGIFSDFDEENKENWDYAWGIETDASYGNDGEIFIQQLYGSMKWKFLQLDIGIKKDDIRLNSISSTNQNFIYSNNARPYPRISISLPDYVDVPLTKGWLAFKMLYSEGVMLDDRYVDQPRLHYKNAYLKLGGDRKWSAEIGLNHYVQWAGESSNPEIGKLASGLKAYKDVVLANDNSEFDELGGDVDHNRLGNHLGMFDMRFSYRFNKIFLQAYRQVIFEDSSGQNLFNRDALMGIFARFNEKKPWIKSVLYEFYTTKYQSGTLAGAKPGGGIHTGKDNYFNHSTYQSGWTSYGHTIGTPFFTTAFFAGGRASGVYNNRITAHHAGVRGYLLNKIPYRALLSYSQNLGTYINPIDKNQVSGYIEVEIPQKKLPFKISTAVAADQGGLFEDCIGFFVRISKSGVL